MFTGIVDHCGQISSIEKNDTKYSVAITSDFSDLELGESIAIDGACLTVVSFANRQFTVELSPETMRLTTAGQYKEKGMVNLERSLRLSDRLSGHFVTGHVDGVCRVHAIQAHNEFLEIAFKDIDQEHRPFLVKKGSVAINGVSLTLNEVSEEGFKIMLIPHTLQRTNLAHLQVGECVNVEYDYLAKLVCKQIANNVQIENSFNHSD
jgi:riboflavin synthase